jgi:hypothetical protein
VLPIAVDAFNTCDPGAHAVDPVTVGEAGAVRTVAVASALEIEIHPVLVFLDSA